MPSPDATSPARLFRRILVATNNSPHSRAALQMAAQLAAGLEAKLDSLFVKNRTLLRAAQLPFAKEVRTHSVAPQRLDDRRAQRQLRSQAERAEATVRKIAERAGVDYAFRVVEGRVTHELLRAADKADLLALGKTSTQSSRRRLGTTTRAVLAEAPTPVLVLRRALQGRRPLFTYYDGSDAAQTALAAAAELAGLGDGHRLTVGLPPTDDATAQQLQAAVNDHCRGRVLVFQTRLLTNAEQQRLATFARRKGHGLVVLPEGAAPLSPPRLQRFLYALDRPFLLVR